MFYHFLSLIVNTKWLLVGELRRRKWGSKLKRGERLQVAAEAKEKAKKKIRKKKVKKAAVAAAQRKKKKAAAALRNLDEEGSREEGRREEETRYFWFYLLKLMSIFWFNLRIMYN